MRVIVRTKRWNLDLEMGRRESDERDVSEESPVVVGGYSESSSDYVPTGLGFTLPSTE